MIGSPATPLLLDIGREFRDGDYDGVSQRLRGGDTAPVPVLSDRLGESKAPPLGSIEVAVGQVTIWLAGATTATRIAEIVRAIGASP